MGIKGSEINRTINPAFNVINDPKMSFEFVSLFPLEERGNIQTETPIII